MDCFSHRRTCAGYLAAACIVCGMTLQWGTPGWAQSANSPSKTLSSNTLSPQIRRVSVPGGLASDIATRLSVKYQSSPEIQIASDAQSGEVIVMAAAPIQSRIANEIAQWIQSSQLATPTHPTSDRFAHRLVHRTAAQFEQNLRQMSSAPPSITRGRSGEIASYRMSALRLAGSTIEVNRSHGQVTVIAGSNKLDGWKKIIASFDAVPETPNQSTVVVSLKNAEPAPIQRVIRLLSKLDKRTRRSKPAHAQAPPQRSPFRQAAFQQADVAPADGDDGQRDRAQTSEQEGGAGVIGDTEIQFVPELGTIIIKGTKREIQRVREVIEQIEKQSEVTKPDVEVVQLQHANANAVADLLRQLYEDVLSARQGNVSITSLDTPNALLLIGRTEAIKSLLELIQKIDQPIDRSNRLRVFRLQNASALDAEQSVRDFFTDRPGASADPRPGLGARVRVLADYRTNSLIVSASPRDLQQVEDLVGELDAKQVKATTQIKIFALRNAVAEDLAPVIQSAISGQSENADTNLTPPATGISIVNTQGGQPFRSGVLAGAVVTADAGGNAIIVRAPAEGMSLIAELIRQLDQAPGIETLIKVFTIENGDALQLTTSLRDLFGDDAATNGTGVGAANLAELPPITGGSDSSLTPLRFSTDQRTNSIIASGSAEDLEVVESILLRLDSQGFANRITEVIWLRHQTAADIAAALQDYVSQRGQSINSIQQFQQGLGPFDLPDRDLIVVAEPVTNSILLSVSPRLYEEVRRLIDRLDRRPPMVLVKVVLAEVGLDDTFEIGTELGLQDSLIFDRGIAAGAFPGANAPSNPGFNFNNAIPESIVAGVPVGNSFGQGNVAARGISNFGLGTTNTDLGFGGFVLSAASDSVSLLLRTLQEANRMQVLSRPQVMTLDNVEASVQVGSQIARIRDVTQNATGSLVSTEDINVGLILQIRPRVGADGLIIIDVDAERSARDPTEGTPIPDGDGGFVVIDDIVTTNAQATVAAFSGQTVIFGGLIQKSRVQFSRRIPLVADIPILGNLFKFEQEAEERSELLIILTPTLVTGEEDLDYVKEVESSRMSWCLADVVEMHGDVGLNGGHGLWGPATSQTIYPDVQPTIDDIIIHDNVSEDATPIQSVTPVQSAAPIGPAAGADSGSATRMIPDHGSPPPYDLPLPHDQGSLSPTVPGGATRGIPPAVRSPVDPPQVDFSDHQTIIGPQGLSDAGEAPTTTSVGASKPTAVQAKTVSGPTRLPPTSLQRATFRTGEQP